MTRNQSERDGVLAGRYVDGEMDAGERAAFESRLDNEPELAAMIFDLRTTREWFVSGPVPRPSEGFRARVLSSAIASAETRDHERLVTWSRRVLYTAAALIVLGVLVAAGVLRPAYSGKLEASPAEVEQAMDALDAKIRAEVGRQDRR